MKCPQCNSPLKEGNYEADIQIDLCASCGGMWLNKGELEAIQETVEHDYSDILYKIGTVARAYELARQKALAGRTCPHCHRLLASKEYGYCSQILIEMCPQCEGVWLDRGEMQALEQFFERERPDIMKARPGEMRKGFFASLLKLFGD
jgi:Zn-finger nucleic acid-binding protein